MKRTFYFLLSALLMLAVSCNREDAPEASLKLSPTEVTIPSDGGSKAISVTTNVSWTATPSDSWLVISPAQGSGDAKILLTVEANPVADREGTITVNAGSKSAVVKVIQNMVYIPLGGGDGTEANPLCIINAEDLELFSAKVNAGEYLNAFVVMDRDVDMTGRVFTPIAQNASKPFAGSFDGAGHKISNLTIANKAEAASGLFAYLKGATVKNVSLVDADFDSEYVYGGSIAGFVRNSTVEGCSVTGKVRGYKNGITVSDTEYAIVASGNSGYSGGIAGCVINSTFRNCSFDGNATFYGKFSGGAFGMSMNSTIEGCSVSKESTINVYYHYSGGIVGRARGAKNVIKGCSFEGNFTTVGYCAGGIVGQLLGGVVEDCVFGSYAKLGSDKYFVGGIVGSAQGENPIVINRCAAYGSVKGAYSVAGICGYAGVGSGASDKDLVLTGKSEITISGCALIGGTVTATSGNGSKYPIAAGIIGWSHTGGKFVVSGCYSRPGLIQTTYGDHVNGVLSGISAYQNNAAGAVYENCYSAFSVNDLLVCGDQAAANPALWYAGVHIRCTQPTEVKNCYSESSMRVGYSSSAATETGCTQYTVAQMTDGTMLQALKAGETKVSWVSGADGYPTVENLPADPNVKPKSAKRVSVIGDSISTFKGWIPGGYSAHYPATDGTLTLVNETYWYRLVHDFLKNAEFDTNIAFSGSTVTNTTDENYAARYGTASNTWFKNDFPTRFAKCGGMGNPDIILIHGGTNDWSHNADPLAPGVSIRNDATNIYGGSAPSEALMKALFDKADAARTRAEINALPDGTFCEAYIKLMCQIRERHPRAKVVCIIGDYLNQAIEQSTIQIADHYGAKVVNLFRVNGFNDLGGYTPTTLVNKGKQPNMPKHDYSGDIGGCHPGSKAMEFIANKIYTELGSWLEE